MKNSKIGCIEVRKTRISMKQSKNFIKLFSVISTKLLTRLFLRLKKKPGKEELTFFFSGLNFS